MIKKLYSSDFFVIIFIILLSFAAFKALLVPGFYGASDDVHVAWLYEMYETLKLGQIPPRFVPDLSFRHGYPLFNFVFPLPYYMGSVLHLIGFNLVDSIKTIFIISLPLSGYFMYKLLRRFSGIFLSLLGALLYIYTPYRSTDIYVRGALGEAVSFIFLPLIILAFLNLTGRPDFKNTKKWLGIAALSFALLILTHNITAYMFFPILLLLILIRLIKSGWNKILLKNVIVSILLGLSISIYFWFPAIYESNLMKYNTVFNYWDHFPALKQLIIPYFGYGASVPGPGDGMSFFIGIANLVTLLAAVYVYLFLNRSLEKKDRTILTWAFLVFLTGIFMMNFRSSFLWKTIPLLPYFQFPWRFLTLITLVTPLMVVSLKYLKFTKFAGLVLVLSVILAFPYFKPHDFLGRTDDYYLAKYIPFPEIKPEYLTHQEEYLRLPKLTEEKPTQWPGIHTFQDSGLININNQQETRLSVKAEVVTSGNLKASYGKYYFPGWTVIDNGIKIKSYGSSPYGDVTFDLEGPGVHKIEIYFKETTYRLLFDIISLISFIAAFYFIFYGKVKKVSDTSD